MSERSQNQGGITVIKSFHSRSLRSMAPIFGRRERSRSAPSVIRIMRASFICGRKSPPRGSSSNTRGGGRWKPADGLWAVRVSKCGVDLATMQRTEPNPGQKPKSLIVAQYSVTSDTWHQRRSLLKPIRSRPGFDPDRDGFPRGLDMPAKREGTSPDAPGDKEL